MRDADRAEEARLRPPGRVRDAPSRRWRPPAKRTEFEGWHKVTSDEKEWLKTAGLGLVGAVGLLAFIRLWIEIAVMFA